MSKGRQRRVHPEKFLALAKPMEGRIDLVVNHQHLALRLKFLSLPCGQYDKLRKELASALDTTYRIAYKDGAVDERRLIEQKIKRVL